MKKVRLIDYIKDVGKYHFKDGIRYYFVENNVLMIQDGERKYPSEFYLKFGYLKGTDVEFSIHSVEMGTAIEIDEIPKKYFS